MPVTEMDHAGVSPRTRWTARILLVFFSIALSLVAAEIGMRAVGFYPRPVRFEPNRPAFNEPDAALGWRNKPGQYVLPGFTPGAADIRVTNWSNGRRATGPVDEQGRTTVALVGCSYTQGWALSDEETFPWKLQQRFPGYKIDNYGTAGYSTYQVLLKLERLFASGAKPAIVTYGLLDIHEVRNVAAWWWLQYFASYNNRGHLDVPFCTVNSAGELVRHAPERYVSTALGDKLRTFGLLDQFHMRWKTRGREAQKQAVTEQLLIAMEKLCARNGVDFFVSMLSSDDDDVRVHYKEFCAAHNIPFVDTCYRKTQDMRVPGDGHPNGKATTLLARNIGDALEPRLARLQ